MFLVPSSTGRDREEQTRVSCLGSCRLDRGTFVYTAQQKRSGSKDSEPRVQKQWIVCLQCLPQKCEFKTPMGVSRGSEEEKVL